MKKALKVIAILLVLCVVLTSCKKNTVSFSDGLDEYGYFAGVKASDCVTFGDFDNIVLSQAEIDAAINEVLEAFPDTYEIMDRAVKDDDAFYFDFVGSMDGVEFEGGKGENALGDLQNDTFIPGFLSQIIGHYPGQVFDIDVTFPDPYENNPDFSGKPATFKITLKSIVGYTPAEFNDEFVKNHLEGSGFETAQDVYDYLKLSLLEEYMVENVEINEIPEAVMKWVENVAVLSNQLTAKRVKGVEEITYLKSEYGVSSEEEFLEKYKDDLTQEAETGLMFQALAEKEGIKPTDDDVKQYFADRNESDYYEESIELFGAPYFKQIIMQNKIIDKYLAKAVIQ